MINIDNLSIEFPYELYECQKLFMEKVVHALNHSTNAALESPTGTGKTLSLLCATISWLLNEKQRLKPSITNNIINPQAKKTFENNNVSSLFPKIYYASRTHSQLQQVVRELNKTKYKSMIKVATLAGREHLCLNEKVIKEKNSEIKSHMCRTLVQNKKCHYYNMLDKEGDLIDSIYSNEAKSEVLDIEDLKTVAKKLRHCPFYRVRQIEKSADLILLPYNYILDPKTRAAYDIKLQGNILIFDEAHNLSSIAEESVSINFSTKSLVLAIEECKKAIQLLIDEENVLRDEMDNSGVDFCTLMEKSKTNFISKKEDKLKKNLVVELLQNLQTLDEKFNEIDFFHTGVQVGKTKGRVLPGNFMIKLLQKSNFSKTNKANVCKLIDQIGVFLAEKNEKNGKLWSERSAYLAEFSNFIAKVFVDTFEGIALSENNQQFQKRLNILEKNNTDFSQFFQLYVEVEGIKKIFHYWCFSAGVAMRFLYSRGVRSIILASGTLSPIEQFVSSMAIPFDCILENKHAGKSDQLIVGALKEGFNKVDITGTFYKRNELAYQMAIGELLLETIKVTPQGVLAFFPSYSQLEAFISCWQQNKLANTSFFLWHLIAKHKQIFIEPKEKSEISRVFEEFNSAIYKTDSSTSVTSGALFLAVCRGKLSEGIDFSDCHSRAVFIVGIPFPPAFEPRILLKKLFLTERRKKDSSTINPEEWYQIEGYRSVNQAIGRIIRHKNDFGVVVLADSRYALSNFKMFPSWVRPSARVFESPNQLFIEINRFFIERNVLIKKTYNKSLELATFNSDMSRKRKNDNQEKNFKFNFDFQSIYGDALREKFSEKKNNEALFLNEAYEEISKASNSEKKYPNFLSLSNLDKYEEVFTNIESLKHPTKKKLKLKENIKISAVTNLPNKACTSKLIEMHKKLNQNIETKIKSNTCETNFNKNEINAINPEAFDSFDNDDLYEPILNKSKTIKKLNLIKTCNIENETNNITKQLDTTHSCLKSTTIENNKAAVEENEKSVCTLDKKNTLHISLLSLSIEEYKLLMSKLEKSKRLNLMHAQKLYLQNHNFEKLISSLKSIALPDDPLLFSGFHGFLQNEHKQLHYNLCKNLSLL